MKTALAKAKTNGLRKKKIVLVRGTAAEIRASLHISRADERRGRAALAAVSPIDAQRAAAKERAAAAKASPKSTPKTASRK